MADVTKINGYTIKDANAPHPSNAGSAGQVLKKTETGTEWADAPQTVTIPETTALLKGDGIGGVAAVTTDATPTQGSTNPVQSGGVYTALADKLDKTGDGSNVTAAFTAASSRTNIATGEKLSVLFGKIAKWFSDLGSLAFKSTVAKTDLADDVQTSLGKADSALQSAPVTSVNGKTGAVTINVPTVPSTTSLIKGNGSGGLAAATANVDYALRPTTRKVTLTASGWNSSTKQQTVTCSGVLSDTTKQLLIPTPVNTAAGNPYDEASIQMVAQGANSVTFYADTVPTESIDVYVTISPINYLE